MARTEPEDPAGTTRQRGRPRAIHGPARKNLSYIVTLGVWGNSLGFRVPAAVMRGLGWREGKKVRVTPIRERDGGTTRTGVWVEIHKGK